MRISDWSSDVCSSDLAVDLGERGIAIIGVDRRDRDHVGVLRGERDQRVVTLAYVRGIARKRLVGTAEPHRAEGIDRQIGSASCRERVWPYVLISVVAVLLKKNKTNYPSKDYEH